MTDRGLHSVAADLSDSWLRDWAAVGIEELALYLQKVAAFELYLAASGRA